MGTAHQAGRELVEAGPADLGNYRTMVWEGKRLNIVSFTLSSPG